MQVGGFGPIPGQVHHFLMKTEEEQKEMAYSIDRYLTEVRRLPDLTAGLWLSVV